MISMNRPSRGLCESATTTRYVGCFFLPTRIKRILTDTDKLLEQRKAERGRLAAQRRAHRLGLTSWAEARGSRPRPDRRDHRSPAGAGRTDSPPPPRADPWAEPWCRPA